MYIRRGAAAEESSACWISIPSVPWKCLQPAYSSIPPTFRATTTIPTVMVNVGDPVGAGLVASLARPGGNVTGNSALNPELNTKRLEILKDAVPKLARVGVLFGGGVSAELQLKELRPAASALKLKLEEIF